MNRKMILMSLLCVGFATQMVVGMYQADLQKCAYNIVVVSVYQKMAVDQVCYGVGGADAIPNYFDCMNAVNSQFSTWLKSGLSEEAILNNVNSQIGQFNRDEQVKNQAKRDSKTMLRTAVFEHAERVAQARVAKSCKRKCEFE